MDQENQVVQVEFKINKGIEIFDEASAPADVVHPGIILSGDADQMVAQKLARERRKKHRAVPPAAGDHPNRVPIASVVVRTLIKILMVVLICYVAWGLINAAIQRRMRQEMPDDESEDEQEEGGAGGSRIATLLLLLRKFMLVVILVMAVLIILSALGVNIGPLIAGAGVFGLAIGFGAQTLVRDIISGVFFLMDDAFRVGDYLEVSGTKGTVEHISLRSLRLRNPRGQVYFIPFGGMKKEVYRLMQEAFKEEDIEFAHRNVTVYLPQEVQKAVAQADPDTRQKLIESGAAGALATIEAEEQAKLIQSSSPIT